MNLDFSQPQHQSQKGIIILALIFYGKILKNFWFLILFFLFKKKEHSIEIIILIALAALVFAAVQAYIKYQYFTYQIDFENDEFIIKHGVFNKKTILLEKNKIQEVNINQPFFHRFLNIYQLEIDSPGTDKKEITINAISDENAQYLRSYLLDKKEVAVENVEEEKVENPQLKIATSSLLKYAVTANYVKSFLALISLLVYLSQQIFDNLNLDFEDFIKENGTVENFATLSIFTIIFGFLFLALIGVFINVVRTFAVYFNLKITKFTDYLSIEYGLFNTKNQIISKNKVQIFTITQNYFQKKWDVLHLKFNQIGDENSKNNSSNILGCSRKEKEELLQFLYGEVPVFEKLIKPNYRFIISRSIVFVISPLIIGFSLFAENSELLYYSIIYSIFAAAFIYFSFENSRLKYNEDFIAKQSGIWDVEQKTITIEKIQTVKISQYFWQKKSGLGNIFFSTAGGSIRMKTAKIIDLKNLANYCLYKVESSSKNWM